MISRADLITYVMYAACIVVCVIKSGLLVRVRQALFDLPTNQRGLVTILADNNLGWCTTMVLTGGVIVLRAAGVAILNDNPLIGRFAILGWLLITSSGGLMRLGRWFLYDDDGADRGTPATGLGTNDQIERLILRLQREQRRRAGEDERGIPDLPGDD